MQNNEGFWLVLGRKGFLIQRRPIRLNLGGNFGSHRTDWDPGWRMESLSRGVSRSLLLFLLSSIIIRKLSN